MLRREVLLLYKEFMRVCYQLEPNSRKDMIAWVRADFKKNKTVGDEVSTYTLDDLDAFFAFAM